ncbi:hypothetical protein pb186bvf_002019 [Paramecium bursaria]
MKSKDLLYLIQQNYLKNKRSHIQLEPINRSNQHMKISQQPYKSRSTHENNSKSPQSYFDLFIQLRQQKKDGQSSTKNQYIKRQFLGQNKLVEGRSIVNIINRNQQKLEELVNKQVNNKFRKTIVMLERERQSISNNDGQKILRRSLYEPPVQQLIGWQTDNDDQYYF